MSTSIDNIDRLYELLPAIHRIRDAEQGEPLKALLRVIAEQVNLVEEDIGRLYDNWFIETCEDWVVPYVADLVGYRQIHEAGEPGDVRSEQSRARNKILIPRREVANTIRYRRRKGTLALLELLANDVAGWPARAVELYRLLGWTQSLNHLHLDRARTIDVRNIRALELLDGPFDELAHTVDVRRINSQHTQGRYNIPSVGLFIWRLKTYSVTKTPAFCVEAAGPHCYTFSVLGNNAPLFLKSEAETDPTHIADEFNLPVPIRRRLLEDHLHRLYGEEKSFFIWKGVKRGTEIVLEELKEKIIAANLTDWTYLPHKGTVAVDPVLGRIAFPPQHTPKNGVWVSYHYGFSADVGGGEYDRTVSQPPGSVLYQVSEGREFKTLGKALQKWREESKPDAVIEIDDSRVYVEQLMIEFGEGQKSLQLRAANGRRPVIRLLDWQTNQPDALTVTGPAGSRFTLDGLLITGRSVQLGGDLQKVMIRHSTLVPGWEIDNDCESKHPTEPSLEIFSPNVCVMIEHSILGSIQVNPIVSTSDGGSAPKDSHSDDEVLRAHCQGIGPDYRLDPIRVCISDTIIDAVHPDNEAIGAPGCPVAHTVLTICRSTVFGHVQVHAIELGENSIFNSRLTVARRQYGCLRFCYVTPGSRTPPRYHCQPDLVELPVRATLPSSSSDEARELALAPERQRVLPQFNSTRYGTPTYCQLAQTCAEEISRGADDESEMGVFHDLFQPQREANLRVRLDEYIPAGADVGIIVVS
ncbi:MAG: hypothetical protein H8K07_05650 [Nitrospira sp.]|jgi:hypothetical protein|nr:hypothetical protein [Nitrospira sp.]MDI3466991.1 hypothetical protein [Nitrospira sp.]